MTLSSSPISNAPLGKTVSSARPSHSHNMSRLAVVTRSICALEFAQPCWMLSTSWGFSSNNVVDVAVLRANCRSRVPSPLCPTHLQTDTGTISAMPPSAIPECVRFRSQCGPTYQRTAPALRQIRCSSCKRDMSPR